MRRAQPQILSETVRAFFSRSVTVLLVTDVRGEMQTLIAGVQAGRSLEELIDASPFAVLVANDAGVFVMTNRAASTLTGYSLDELHKLSVWQLTPDTHEREAETLCVRFVSRANSPERIGCCSRTAGQCSRSTRPGRTSCAGSMSLFSANLSNVSSQATRRRAVCRAR